MNEELTHYAQNTENDSANFRLAEWYEGKGHLSPACSYYLRCAELTKEDTMAEIAAKIVGLVQVWA